MRCARPGGAEQGSHSVSSQQVTVRPRALMLPARAGDRKQGRCQRGPGCFEGEMLYLGFTEPAGLNICQQKKVLECKLKPHYL